MTYKVIPGYVRMVQNVFDSGYHLQAIIPDASQLAPYKQYRKNSVISIAAMFTGLVRKEFCIETQFKNSVPIDHNAHVLYAPITDEDATVIKLKQTDLNSIALEIDDFLKTCIEYRLSSE